jgi:hypothetical protein
VSAFLSLINPCYIAEYDMCSPSIYSTPSDFGKVALKIDGVTEEFLED